MQHTAAHSNALLQHDSFAGCNAISQRNTLLQHTATHCNTLQHTATQYNTLQHTATIAFAGGNAISQRFSDIADGHRKVALYRTCESWLNTGLLRIDVIQDFWELILYRTFENWCNTGLLRIYFIQDLWEFISQVLYKITIALTFGRFPVWNHHSADFWVISAHWQNFSTVSAMVISCIKSPQRWYLRNFLNTITIAKRDFLYEIIKALTFE